jgi:RecA-family ATPase
MQQLAAATVLGRDWIGMVPEQGPALYLSAEETSDEICRRLEPIAKLYGVERRALVGDLHAVSFAGQDATLARIDRDGTLKPTKLFERVQRDAARIKPAVIIIDSTADMFGGNEIDRNQVRRFVTMCTGPALETGAAVILVGHPSLTGIKDDTGISGSTAWHNSVRARFYLKSAKADDNTSNLRKLEFRKNNYGPIGATIPLRWRDGLYELLPGQDAFAKAATDQKADDVFMMLLRRYTEQGRRVCDKTGTTYAPAKFAEEPEAKGLSKNQLAEAMRRLFAAKRLRVLEEGPPTRRRSWIAEAGTDLFEEAPK